MLRVLDFSEIFTKSAIITLSLPPTHTHTCAHTHTGIQQKQVSKVLLEDGVVASIEEDGRTKSNGTVTASTLRGVPGHILLRPYKVVCIHGEGLI